jgi:uncharacterized protein YqeY
MEMERQPKSKDDNESQLLQRLTNDLRQALRNQDKTRRSVIRLVMAAIKNTEITRQEKLVDNDILGIIAKEARQRRESIESFKAGNRQDLVVQEETELSILNEYLPKQMTKKEILEAARLIIEQTGAEGISDKGKVMPKLIAQLKGKADGREINAVVTELLQ